MFKRQVSLIKRIQRRLALWLALFLRAVLKILGRQATSFPGEIAMYVYPDFLKDLVYGRRLTVVTGTNGKSTISYLLAEILRNYGYIVIHNSSGANMEDGLISACIAEKEKLEERVDLVFEIDEAWFAKLAPILDTDLVVISNLFLDQIDRNGDIFAVRQKLLKGIKASPEAVLVLNADDPHVASLAKEVQNEVKYFALAEPLRDEVEQNPQSSCPICTHNLAYTSLSFDKLGVYHCDHCGLEYPQPDLELSIEDERYSIIQEGAQETELKLTNPPKYQLYNYCAACLAALHLDVEMRDCLEVFEKFRSISGRNEAVKWTKDREYCLTLAKNAVSFSLSLEKLKSGAYKHILLAVNNKRNDGRDTAWLQDIDFSPLQNIPEDGLMVISGSCAEELAKQVKAQLPERSEYIIETSIPAAYALLDEKIPAGDKLYISPNYTAMIEIKAVL